MKVTFINYYYDKDTSIDEYFNKYPTIHGWAKALSDLGVQVTVYHRFKQDYFFKEDGIEYFLVNDGKRYDLKWYQNPVSFHSKISGENHNIIHVNSFMYSYQAYILKSKNPSAKIVVQHHAEKPGRKIKRILLKHLSSSFDGFIFSSQEIYDDWIKTKSIAIGKKFSGIMEGSSDFTFRNRNEMRLKTGVSGKPVLLWVGRLNENKDPLTVLFGFSKILQNFPEAKLYMIYSEDKLKQQVLSFIHKNSLLVNAVKLLGFISHDEISDYYNSADYFVLGSHYEGSGYSLVEAMSCGVIPIVTSIPSFRMMTNNGQLGRLWNCDNADSFAQNAGIILNKSIEIESKKTLDYFTENLSYPAIALRAKNFYESLIED